MTAVAVNVDSRDCRSPGCPREAHYAKGPMAGYCTACWSTIRRGQNRTQPVAAPAPVATTSPTSTPPADDTRPLRSILKDVDAALVDLDKARAAELRAADTYRAARRRVDEAKQKVNQIRAILDRAIDGPDDA